MSPLEWTLIGAVLFAGGVVKGAIGFALPILVVPFLALFIGPRDAVVLMAVPVLLTNLANARIGWREWRNLRDIVPYILTAVVFVPVGVRFLYWGDAETIRLLLGAAIFVYLAARRFMPQLGEVRPALRWGAGAGFGTAAGFLAGMSSVPGPVSIIYFSMFSWPKDTFIFLINFFNAAASGGLVSTLALRGSFTPAVLLSVAAALVPIFAGFWAGVRLRARIGQEVFYRVVRIALLFIAASLTGRSLWGLLS